MRIQVRISFAVALSIATHLTAQASWAQVATTGPSARWLHAMAYDSLRGRTVLFGGTLGIGGFLGDTWEWNGSVWLIQPYGQLQSRGGHAMAYDSQRGRTVLFGGADLNGSLGDTWERNGTTWTQVATIGPSARAGHALAYDSVRGKTVLFGGSGASGYLGDTWEWNGSTWTQVAITGPFARTGHALACDSVRGRAVLFGGVGSGGILGDTWEWDGSNWTQAAISGPSARVAHAIAYDSQSGRVILFGGADNTGIPGDHWEWNGSVWLYRLTASWPLARENHAMAYDSVRGRTVLFGGIAQGSIVLGDTWEWNSTPAPGTATPFGNGCGNPALTVSAVANALPTISTTAQASLTNVPSSLAFVALGWSRTLVGPFALPFPLVGYGMLGCYMLQSTEVAAQPVTFTGPGTAIYSLPLPNWSGLVGLHLYLQGWAAAPGVNPGNAIVSNGLEWVIGY